MICAHVPDFSMENQSSQNCGNCSRCRLLPAYKNVCPNEIEVIFVIHHDIQNTPNHKILYFIEIEYNYILSNIKKMEFYLALLVITTALANAQDTGANNLASSDGRLACLEEEQLRIRNRMEQWKKQDAHIKELPGLVSSLQERITRFESKC